MVRITAAAVFVSVVLASDCSFAQREDVSHPEVMYSLKTASGNNQTVALGGPSEILTYKSTGDHHSDDQFDNTFGKFVIGPGKKEGNAKYWWRGKGPASNPNSQHNDKLKYVNRVDVEDTRPETASIVSGWLYEATDAAGDKFWLVFGEDKVQGLPFYPVYYSTVPPPNNKFRRWLTYSGTRRL